MVLRGQIQKLIKFGIDFLIKLSYNHDTTRIKYNQFQASAALRYDYLMRAPHISLHIAPVLQQAGIRYVVSRWLRKKGDHISTPYSFLLHVLCAVRHRVFHFYFSQGGTKLDIYSAENAIKKLLTYVEDLADTKPRMYGKSKDRLKDIASTCNKVVEAISDILEEEALKDDSVEFGQTSSIVDMVGNMRNRLDRVQEFTDGAAAVKPVTDSDSLSSSTKRAALRTYRTCLFNLSNHHSDYQFADRCAKLIWTWFDVRFLKTVYNTQFRYSIKRFSDWIEAIVILYGQAIHDNCVGEFEANFQNWISSIINTDAKDKYAIPYNVYAFCKDPDPSVITLDAVVLWDILLDNGLRDLCTPAKDDLYLNEYAVYDICDTYNPSMLDNYCDYSTHRELISSLNWRK